MLQFLSKNKHNTVAIEKNRQDDKETKAGYERVKRLRQELGLAHKPASKYEPLANLSTLQKQNPSGQLKKMFAAQERNLQVKKDVRSIVMDVIDKVVLCDLDSLRCCAEPVCAPALNTILENSTLTGKIQNKIKIDHEFRTWSERSKIIYFCLHPALGNGDKKLTAEFFGLPFSTLRTWMNNENYYQKWLSFVKSLAVSAGLNSIRKA